MNSAAPAPAPSGAARGEPLLVTAELPGEVFAWADALRQAHCPPERNRLGAHVTLLHALPPSADGEVRRLLGELAREPAPEARVTGLMDLGGGTAFAIDSPGMADLHAELTERLRGLVQQKDDRALRLHITVQNKVTPREARELQKRLNAIPEPSRFRFRGFGLYSWDGALWRLRRTYAFRGAK